MASEEAVAAVKAAIAKRTVFEIEAELSRRERTIAYWTSRGGLLPRVPPSLAHYVLSEIAQLKEELLSKDG